MSNFISVQSEQWSQLQLKSSDIKQVSHWEAVWGEKAVWALLETSNLRLEGHSVGRWVWKDQHFSCCILTSCYPFRVRCVSAPTHWGKTLPKKDFLYKNRHCHSHVPPNTHTHTNKEHNVYFLSAHNTQIHTLSANKLRLAHYPCKWKEKHTHSTLTSDWPRACQRGLSEPIRGQCPLCPADANNVPFLSTNHLDDKANTTATLKARTCGGKHFWARQVLDKSMWKHLDCVRRLNDSCTREWALST